MSPVLINHSDDLRRLRDEGYEIEVRGGHLMVHHIPYVNSMRNIAYGILVSPLSINAGKTITPHNHVIYFIGEQPCNVDGKTIAAIMHASNQQQLGADLTVDRSFSNKPPNGYIDYFEKVNTYATIITSQAQAIDSSCTAKTYRQIEDNEEETVFAYPDTNTVRARIAMINAKLQGQKIAIVGIGGTGGYILDLIAKTPVAEIHLFDGDIFLQHNAFRAPGAATLQELDQYTKKVEYFQKKYAAMHKHIIAHPYRITSENVSELSDMNYVFVSLDKNSSRKVILEYLEKYNLHFVDIGMGIELFNDSLLGIVRVTSGSPGNYAHIANRVALEDAEDELYASNIQIADLNMLNAAMAVLKWKKDCGFYHDLIQEHNETYTINSAQLDTSDFQT